jgi:hypothetical protein
MVNQKRFFALMGNIRIKILLFGNHRNHIAVNSAGKQVAIELLQMLNRRLRAVDKNFVNTIGTFLPICAHCTKIKDQNGTWLTIEEYIVDHTDSEFSHEVCPECTAKECSAP